MYKMNSYLVLSEPCGGAASICWLVLFVWSCSNSVPIDIIVRVDDNGISVLAGNGDCSETADANTSNRDALITKKNIYIQNKSQYQADIHYSQITLLGSNVKQSNDVNTNR